MASHYIHIFHTNTDTKTKTDANTDMSGNGGLLRVTVKFVVLFVKHDF